MASASKITRVDFDKALARYPALINSISAEKAGKAGRGESSATLAELDVIRFTALPGIYSKDIAKNPSKGITKDHLIDLVTWKLKHGTFRPNLLQLAASNTPEEILDTTTSVFATYDTNSEVESAVQTLCRLKGIGPATASLILSIHDAPQVLFFSDEAYIWLVGGSKKEIKYTAKELSNLVSKGQELIKRLNVDARDVEKVAFVLMQSDSTTPSSAPKSAKAETTKPQKTSAELAARKLQLQQTAARARELRKVNKAAAAAEKEEKGRAFRERIDKAREAAKKAGTYVVKGPYVPSGKPRGRPKGSGKAEGAVGTPARSSVRGPGAAKGRGRPNGSVKQKADEEETPMEGSAKKARKE